MKAPLSEDYSSTIHIADVSVCEAPVYKVTNWIDNNDFTPIGDVLRSESLHSITTSEMITYICEKGKRSNHTISHLSRGNSDTNLLEVILSKLVAVDSDQMSEDGSEVPSHYLCDVDHGNTVKKPDKPNTDDETCSEISENSDVPSHYLCERKQCVPKIDSDIDIDDISSELSEENGVPSHYLCEAGHHRNRKTSSFSVTTPSNDSISLYSDSMFLPEEDSASNNSVTLQNDFQKLNRKPPNLFILRESLSVPLLTPKTVNPLFVKPTLGDSLSFTPLIPSASKTKLIQKSLKMSNHQSSGNNDTQSHYFCEDKCCKRKAPLSPHFTQFQTDCDGSTSQCSNVLLSDNDRVSDADASLLSVSNEDSLNLFITSVDPEVLSTPLTTNPPFGDDIRPDSFRFMPLVTQPVSEIEPVERDVQNLDQATETDDVFSQQSGSIDWLSSDINEIDSSKVKHSLSPYYGKATDIHCSSNMDNSHNKDTPINDNLSHAKFTPQTSAAANKALDLSLHDTSNLEVLYTPKITNPIFIDNCKLNLTDLPTTVVCKETNNALELDFEENEFETYDTDSQADTCAGSDADSSDLGYWK